MRFKGYIIILTILTIAVSCKSKKEIANTKIEISKDLSTNKKEKYYLIFLEANRKKFLGDIEASLALYYQCLEIYPESSAAMSEISKINEIKKNYNVAIKYAENAVKLDPENKWYKIDLARLYAVTNNIKKASEIYENLYKNNPNDFEITYKLANIYVHTGDYKKAIEIFTVLENKVGINEELALTKQKLYLQTGNKTKAYNEIQKLIKYYPEQPKYYGIIAEMYTNDKLYLKAKEYYNKLFQLDSTNILGQLSIIDFYRKKMDYDNAFNIFNKVIINKDIEYNDKVLIFVSFLNNRSEFNICNKQIEESIHLLKQTFPGKKDSYTLYADYLIKMNELDKAKNEIEYILENFEGNIVLWEQLLSIYNYNSNYKQLYEKSKTAIDSFPEHTAFYLFSGVSATQIKKLDEAVEIFKNGLKMANNDQKIELEFYTYLGEVYYEKNDYEKSDYYFDLVLQNEPDNLYVINNYSYYLSLREEKLEYAETISKKTVEAEPGNSTYLDTYSWILFKLKKYDKALTYIKKAFENGGDKSPVIVEHYGDILYMTGNKVEALKLWKKSLEIGNEDEKLKLKIEQKSINIQ